MADQSSDVTRDPAHANAPQGDDSLRATSNSASVGSSAHSGSSTGGSSARADVLLSPEAQQTVISRNRPEGGSSSIPPPANPLEMAVMLEGQRLGHFELEQFVGGGGMGAVFRAKDTLLDRTVAVKILSRHQTDDEIIRRFKNEAQSAARLDHPNIARVYYVGEDQGWNYIVFEFIEGVNIRDLVESKGPLSLEEAFSFTLQIAEALEHACLRDVVHRDIKPSNVLVMPDGRAKLVDMGLARLHQVEAGDDDLTASGVTLGTFDYISPEQARDPRSADVRSDIYSLGCTLYYMLTGRPPFAGTAIKKLLSHASDAPPNLRQFRSDIPDEVVTLVNRMMAKRPQDRYQRPSELVGELLLLADQLGLTGATQGGTVWITQERSHLARLAPVFISLAALLLLAVGIVAFRQLTSSSTETAEGWGEVKLQPQIERPVVPLAPERNPRTSANSAIPNAVTQNDGTGDSGSPTATPSGDSGGDSVSGNGISPLDLGPPAPNAFAEFYGPMDSDLLTESDVPALLDLRPSAEEIGYLSGSSDDSALVSVTDTLPEAEVPALPQTIIVGLAAESAPPPGSITLPTLEQALKYAAETATVTAIEIVPGVYELPSLTIAFNRPESSDEMLTIRARGEVAPVLVFRPQGDDLDEQTSMIRIVGGRHIHWDMVHFWFDLPDEVAVQRWSLFQLQNLSSLTLNNCTMTMQNADAIDRALHEKAAFISVETPMAAEDDVRSMSPLFLGLQSCIARGQAALIRAETATPFGLNWTEGLFVSTEPMVIAGGRAEAAGDSDRIEVDLHNVTAVLPQGLCRLETDLDRPHQLILDVNCVQNIFVSDSQAAFLDREGSESLDDAARAKLLYVGLDNIFWPEAPIFCRLGNAEGESREFRFGGTSDPFMVKSPKEFVMWGGTADPSLDSQAHSRKKEDFLLSDTPQSARSSGFDPDKLPNVPADPPEPVKPAVVPASVEDAESREIEDEVGESE